MDAGVVTTVTLSQPVTIITLTGDSEPIANGPVSITQESDHEVAQFPVLDNSITTSTAIDLSATANEASDAAVAPVHGELQETPAADLTNPTYTVSNAAADAVLETNTAGEEPADEASAEESQQAEEVVGSQLESSTTPAPPSPPEEHAYWAEFEEDDSTPDEAEWKQINSSENGFNAHEHSHWEEYFFKKIDDPEYRPLEKARLAWKIKGVRGTKEKPNRANIMRSPPAFIGGYWWTIKFFPRGNNSSSLSIYLECSSTMPEPDKELPETEFKMVRCEPDAVLDDQTPDVDVKFPPTSDSPAWAANYKAQYAAAANSTSARELSAGQKRNWRVSAQIGVTLYNPNEPSTGWVQSSCHQFSPHNPDWGWTNFHGNWDQIHRRRPGQRQPLLKNDTLAFDAYIRIFEDPTQSLWWHPSDSEPTWDSLALTGFRPLGDSIINHSADVAGLASWLHIGPIAKLIQSVDVLEHLRDSDVTPRLLCDALQKCLWLLRCRSDSLQYVDTDVITSTLRNLHESPSDVTEFWECVRRSVELELAGTDAAKTFARLFDSPQVPAAPGSDTVVNTLPNEYNSRICVRADKVDSVQSALDAYLGSKQGRWSLPRILNVELSRYKFDRAAKQWRLIYDRVELDETLDLSSHVVEGTDGQYVLYGYIVHRGRRTSGKFFSILRPGGPGTKWLAFDDGSDNRVECLTRKTAFSTHMGLKRGEKPNEQTGHDVPVTVMYIRNDVVREYLPGPQGPWDVSDALKTYFESGTYPFRETADGKQVHDDKDVQVEVYTLQNYDRLGSVFDTWDLMAHAKATRNVMYLTLPSSSRLIDVRKKIATWKSTDAQRIRLWQIGTRTSLHAGAAVAITRIEDLAETLKDFSLSTVRFWMQIVQESEVKYFAMSDPPQAVLSESKLGETITERDGSETPEERADTPESGSNSLSDAVSGVEAAVPVELSHGVVEEVHVSTTTERDAGESSQSVRAAIDSQTMPSANDATVAAVTPDDLQHSDAETTVVATPTHFETPSERADTPPNDGSSQDRPAAAASVESATPVEPPIQLPVRHVYYFIQIFDIEKQELRTAGSFFSRGEEPIKGELRKHLGWPAAKNMMVWQPGWSVCSTRQTFENTSTDGACFIVGEALTKERRTELTTAGLFSHPEALTQYLRAKARNHPIKSLTGTKTIEAGFTSDYYSGDFLKGCWHGHGTHISASGTVYRGEFAFNHRHGTGKMEYPTGDTYDGEWMQDQRHGQGTFVDGKTGNKYVGGYRNGKRHGKGISYWEVADEELDRCGICYSEEKDALFYDCGHVCACVACANQVELCPICRKKVISVVKIYRV